MSKLANITLFASLLRAAFANAESIEPLGLEVGKATISDAEKKYIIDRRMGNGDQHFGYIYSLDTVSLPLKNILSAAIICNTHEVIQAVMLHINKNNYPVVYAHLKTKYTHINKDTGLVNRLTDTFRADNGLIILYQSFDTDILSIAYVADEYTDKLHALIKAAVPARDPLAAQNYALYN